MFMTMLTSALTWAPRPVGADITPRGAEGGQQRLHAVPPTPASPPRIREERALARLGDAGSHAGLHGLSAGLLNRGIQVLVHRR